MDKLYLPCLLNMSVETAGSSLIVKTGRKESVIPISSIQSVELKEPTKFTRGNLYIYTAKGNSGYYRPMGSVAVGFGGEIRLVFLPEHTERARAIKRYVSEYRGGSTPISEADELRKVKSLLDDGIITEEEFKEKKKKLLGL